MFKNFGNLLVYAAFLTLATERVSHRFSPTICRRALAAELSRADSRLQKMIWCCVWIEDRLRKIIEYKLLQKSYWWSSLGWLLLLAALLHSSLLHQKILKRRWCTMGRWKKILAVDTIISSCLPGSLSGIAALEERWNREASIQHFICSYTSSGRLSATCVQGTTHNMDSHDYSQQVSYYAIMGGEQYTTGVEGNPLQNF